MPQEFPAIRLVALDLDGTLLNRNNDLELIFVDKYIRRAKSANLIS